jgi:hypothetical protein
MNLMTEAVRTSWLYLSSPWCWRQYTPLKRQSASTWLHGATSQETLNFIYVDNGHICQQHCHLSGLTIATEGSHKPYLRTVQLTSQPRRITSTCQYCLRYEFESTKVWWVFRGMIFVRNFMKIQEVHRLIEGQIHKHGTTSCYSL